MASWRRGRQQICSQGNAAVKTSGILLDWPFLPNRTDSLRVTRPLRQKLETWDESADSAFGRAVFGAPVGLGNQQYREESGGFRYKPDAAHQPDVTGIAGHDAGWHAREIELLSQ